ncbi:MAG: NAD-dependent epimerase/dehydratase family protein [Deltaproteobacteria bacterium]|nr:NAD-dependent epimerase/dehydratase family protein [Deltaproteobacteria bacterium]
MTDSTGHNRAVLRAPRARRTVAITGADSFLGRNLIGLLEDDDRIGRIVALDIEQPPTAGRKTRYYRVDLTQPTVDSRIAEILGAEGVDTLLHLAFLASPGYASAWAHELESVGTMHVLNACRERPVHKFVLWSQTLLYGALPTNPNFLTEKHPLRGNRESRYLADKIEAEAVVQRFAKQMPQTIVTILRMAPILGPTVRNYLSRYLGRRLVPTLLGYDPLMQFLHEVDALAALKLATHRDAPGVFNIVGDGVLPLSTVIALAGGANVPFVPMLAKPMASLLWAAQQLEAPASWLDYLRWLCVADGQLAEDVLKFRGSFSTREAVLDYAGAQRLRDARLLRAG